MWNYLDESSTALHLLEETFLKPVGQMTIRPRNRKQFWSVRLTDHFLGFGTHSAFYECSIRSSLSPSSMILSFSFLPCHQGWGRGKVLFFLPSICPIFPRSTTLFFGDSVHVGMIPLSVHVVQLKWLYPWLHRWNVTWAGLPIRTFHPFLLPPPRYSDYLCLSTQPHHSGLRQF